MLTLLSIAAAVPLDLEPPAGLDLQVEVPLSANGCALGTATTSPTGLDGSWELYAARWSVDEVQQEPGEKPCALPPSTHHTQLLGVPLEAAVPAGRSLHVVAGTADVIDAGRDGYRVVIPTSEAVALRVVNGRNIEGMLTLESRRAETLPTPGVERWATAGDVLLMPGWVHPADDALAAAEKHEEGWVLVAKQAGDVVFWSQAEDGLGSAILRVRDGTTKGPAEFGTGLGKTRLVKVPHPVREVVVGNPDAVQVTFRGKKLMVKGTAVGSSGVLVWLEGGEPMVFRMIVVGG